jgi:hypothetical protein
MTKLTKKSLLLFVVAVASMASASSASAATFEPANSTHTLTSSNLSFNIPSLGAGSSCASSTFEVVVSSTGATATVTSGTFDGCVGTGLLTAPAVVSGTNFPWEITTSGIANQFTIDAIHVTADFPSIGVSSTLEGPVEGTYNNTTNTAEFANSTGPTATTSLGNGPATVSGTLTDDSHTLRIT